MAPTDAQFLEVEPTYKCFKRNPTQNGSQMKPDDYEMDQEYSPYATIPEHTDRNDRIESMLSNIETEFSRKNDILSQMPRNGEKLYVSGFFAGRDFCVEFVIFEYMMTVRSYTVKILKFFNFITNQESVNITSKHNTSQIRF